MNASLFDDDDTITGLHSRGPLLAKRITRNGILGYDDARRFDVYPVPVDGLDDIQALLQRLLIAPRCCAIRDELIDPDNRHGVRRLLYGDGDDAPTFRDVPRQWLALDVEHLKRPADVPVTDLAACARLAVARLPLAFQRAGGIVQASASHALKRDIRLRLWFWLSRPAHGGELARWLAPALDGLIDAASFRAVQPIYTAAPIFQDRTADPLPYRLHVLAGEDAVAVPSVEALAPPPPRPPHRPLGAPPRPPKAGERYVDAALADAASTIARAMNGTRHQTLMREGASLLRFVPERLSVRDFADVLTRAALSAGLEQDEIEEGIGWLLLRGGVA
jgi:hypothetical protein